jgi:hypothetical protein
MLAENGRDLLQVKVSTLFLGTDPPYFPGKMGADFFNLRYLAESHRVSVVGPKPLPHQNFPGNKD